MPLPSMFVKKPLIPQAAAYPAAPANGFEYQDPMANLGEIDRIKYLQKNNPEALMSLAAGLMSGNMAEGFAGAGSAMSDYRKQDMKRQEEASARDQAKQFYLSQGLTEAEANAAATNSNIGSSMLNRRELEEKYKLEAQYPDASGESGTHGNLVQLQGPGGVAGVGVIRKSDGRVIDSRTGQELGSDWQVLGPYDVSQQRQLGKGTADATMALPQVELLTKMAVDVSDKVINHPNLDANVGWLDSKTPTIRAGSVEFQKLKEQMTGQAYLSAFEGLKGGGAITEAEGLAATQAKIAVMDGSDPEKFKAAIREYQYWLKRGLEVARQRAGIQPNVIGGPAGGGGMGGGGSDPLGIR